jgi:RNA polymerase sigma factor (sigma-70 family)
MSTQTTDAAGPAGPAGSPAGTSVSDLVTRARSGDRLAWGALVELYAPLIWSICRAHRLGDADADGVGQSVWRRLVQHIGQVSDPAALAGWLATTTRRECLRVPRIAPGPHLADDAPEADVTAGEQTGAAEHEVLAAERQAALREAFLALPPCCQRLITLFIQDPLVPDAQISATLGLPIGAIGPARRRCLDKLRHHQAARS